MTGRDKISLEISARTGAGYAAALAERDRRWQARKLDAYLEAVRALPARSPDDPERCVSCLVLVVGPHECL